MGIAHSVEIDIKANFIPKNILHLLNQGKNWDLFFMILSQAKDT